MYFLVKSRQSNAIVLLHSCFSSYFCWWFSHKIKPFTLWGPKGTLWNIRLEPCDSTLAHTGKLANWTIHWSDREFLLRQSHLSKHVARCQPIAWFVSTTFGTQASWKSCAASEVVSNRGKEALVTWRLFLFFFSLKGYGERREPVWLLWRMQQLKKTWEIQNLTLFHMISVIIIRYYQLATKNYNSTFLKD